MRFIPIFLALMGIVLLGVAIWETNCDPTYSGKEVFYSEHEYVEFKEACAQEEVDIEDIQELSSSTPIVVSFKVRAPEGFPYGRKELESTIAMIVLGFAFVASGIAVGIRDAIEDRELRRLVDER